MGFKIISSREVARSRCGRHFRQLLLGHVAFFVLAPALSIYAARAGEYYDLTVKPSGTIFDKNAKFSGNFNVTRTFCCQYGTTVTLPVDVAYYVGTLGKSGNDNLYGITKSDFSNSFAGLGATQKTSVVAGDGDKGGSITMGLPFDQFIPSRRYPGTERASLLMFDARGGDGGKVAQFGTAGSGGAGGKVDLSGTLHLSYADNSKTSALPGMDTAS